MTAPTPPAARDAGVGELLPATYELSGVELPYAVHMAMARHGCHYDPVLRAAIADALATAAQPARAVPSRAAVEAAIGDYGYARYCEDRDHLQARDASAALAVLLALLGYADAPADASEVTR